MVTPQQALIERITGFDTTPRQLVIQSPGVTLLTYTQSGWQVQAVPRGTNIDVSPSSIPIAASFQDLMPVLSLLPAPDMSLAQPGYEITVHAEGQSNTHPNFTCPELAGFRSVRSAVLRETWAEVKRRERQDEVITNVEFGNILEGVWARAKEATRSCPLGQGIAGEL